MRVVVLAGVVGAAVLGGRRASAAPCDRVVLTGDAETVQQIRDLLAARGLTVDAEGGGSTCAPVHAAIAWRAGAVVVQIATAGAPPVERVTSDPAMAATVIESWTRDDVSSPLLAARPLPPIEGHAVRVVAAPALTASAPERSPRGVQVFGGLETSIGTDRTTWLGAQVGACVMLGPVCAAARLRFATVADGPGPWEHRLERHDFELLLGGDIPLRLGRATLVPGFDAGIGNMFTKLERGDDHMATELGGLRADLHAALVWPVGRGFAVELSSAVDLTQSTHVESSATFDLPDEPQALFRAGVGLRYGGL